MRIGISTTDDPDRYRDMIDPPHHQSSTRQHMSMIDRAAQFASFKAMAGFEEMVDETARLTDDERFLSDEEKALLDRKLTVIIDALRRNEHPEITLTVFVPDEYKKGGRFDKTTGKVKKIELFDRKIVFYGDNGIIDGEVVFLDRIVGIDGDVVANTEDL